jgi:hypothetical protein
MIKKYKKYKKNGWGLKKLKFLKFHRSRSRAAVIQQVPGSGRGIAIGKASATTVSSILAMNKAIGFGI